MEFKIIIGPVFFLWGLAMLLVLFRGGIDWIWKICSVLIFGFYCLWFREELTHSWHDYSEKFGSSLIDLVSGAGPVIAFTLFLFWPIALFIAFFSASKTVGRAFVRTMVLITLFYWIFWFFHAYVQHIPVEYLRSWLPEKIQIPSLPAPPVR